MDDGSWRYLIAYFLLVLGGAYFASSESAFASINKIRMKNYADDGDKRAKRAMYITNNFDKAITTILIGNNIMHISCATLATYITTQIWKLDESTVVYSTIITTVIVFLISEMIPKSYAKANNEKLALAYSASLRFLMKILSPVAFLFIQIGNLFSRLFESKEVPSITEDELATIIDTVEEEGVFDEDRSDLLQSAMEFSKTTVADVLTAREDIIALDIKAQGKDILDKIKQVRHSRLPVYDGSIDNIIGILPIRRYLKNYIKHGTMDIRGMLIPVRFVKSDSKISTLLMDMSRSKTYMSIVVDENKRTLGLVTVEDFLEELVGEIWDEDDIVNDEFIKLGGNRFEISGVLNVRDAFARMGIKCKDPLLENKSVQSWVLETFGHVPAEDDEFEQHDMLITVSAMNGNRIKKIIIKLYPEHAQDLAVSCSAAFGKSGARVNRGTF